METAIREGTLTPGETVVLEAESPDYSGWILVDCAEAAVSLRILARLL